MPTTPNYSLRFPTLGDTPNGPRDYQNLAEDADAALLAVQTLSDDFHANAPYALEAGVATTGVVTTPYELTVNFTAGRFTAPPRVFIQSFEGQVFESSVLSTTVDSALVRIVAPDGTEGGSIIVRAWWLAVGA